jgi:hypothetical protein
MLLAPSVSPKALLLLLSSLLLSLSLLLLLLSLSEAALDRRGCRATQHRHQAHNKSVILTWRQHHRSIKRMQDPSDG